MVDSSRLLAGVVVLSLVVIASAGPNANAFSDQTSRPMMKNMGGDLNFATAIELSNEPDPYGALQQDCNTGGRVCQYMGFIFSNLIVGLFVLPVLIFLFNLIFCCGRCCCRKKGRNKQGCTGGRYPTREYHKMEGVVFIIILVVFMIILFAFTAAGAASFDEIKAEIDLMLDGVGDLGETPTDFKNEINYKLDQLKDDTRSDLAPLNAVFDKVTEIKTSVSDMRTKMTTLQTEVKKLASLIEGCKPGSTSCTASTRVANWNDCAASGYAAGTSGNPAVAPALTNSGVTTLSPTCKNVNTGNVEACQCAPTVQAVLVAVTTTLAAIPTDADLGGLDVRLPLNELDQAIDDAAAEFEKPLDSFQRNMPVTREQTDPIKNSISGSLLSFITFVAYSPAWYTIIMITCALVLGAQFPPFKGNTKANECGDVCWWVAYVVLTLWLLVAVWPLYGVFTVPAVLLEDLCDMLPEPGGSADKLTELLVSGDVDKDLVDLSTGLFEKCLLTQPPEKGYIWDAIPGVTITKDYMRNQVAEFSTGNAINTTQITSNLRVLEYTKEYRNIRSTIAAFDANTYTSFGIPASYESSLAYGTSTTEKNNFQGGDLRKAVDAVDAADAAVWAAIQTTNTKSAEFETSLVNVINSTAKITNNLVDSMWELGTCDLLAEKYAGLYTPFCNIAHIFGASWGALLLSGCFAMLILPCICLTSKRMYQYRVPLREQQEMLAKQGGTIVPAAGAAGTDAPMAGVAVATAVPMAAAVATPVVATADPVGLRGDPPPPPAEAPPAGMYPDLDLGQKET